MASHAARPATSVSWIKEGVVNDVMDFFGEDARYIAEIEDHAVIWGLGIPDQFSTDFGLEPVPVAMEMGTFAAVVWHTVAGVGFDPAADGGGHASSSSKIRHTELMQ